MQTGNPGRLQRTTKLSTAAKLQLSTSGNSSQHQLCCAYYSWHTLSVATVHDSRLCRLALPAHSQVVVSGMLFLKGIAATAGCAHLLKYLCARDITTHCCTADSSVLGCQNLSTLHRCDQHHNRLSTLLQAFSNSTGCIGGKIRSDSGSLPRGMWLGPTVSLGRLCLRKLVDLGCAGIGCRELKLAFSMLLRAYMLACAGIMSCCMSPGFCAHA